MLELWYANVLRYSRRDQLSANLAFREVGLTPGVLDIDDHSSWFHVWPITVGRERDRSRPLARLRRQLSRMRESR